MCGGDLTVEPEATVCECEYCGTKQTVPNTDDEKKLKLFERANRLRFKCDFDKAAGVYESLIEEFPEEAEAYWGNLLCKYGIEYVDDPATGEKVPTCHRSSFDSIMDDPDFDMVMENADVVAVSIYREQAKQIEEIRKGIIEVSGKEEPYDIFICYKETDNEGERTLDSVLAQDVYDALTDKGYRVFFSRISLEDKLGTEYEPYIFAALNSAKIMLAFGTKYEYYNAVWVKNEWGRFLKLMTKEKEKYLIPCYKDIDAYDMPKEFAKLQAQDLGKVGATQDLLRGIDKLMGREAPSQKGTTSGQAIIHQASGGPSVEALLDRGKMSLEDGAFDEAAGYFNRVLDIDSKCAEAYLGLFMSERNTCKRDDARKAFISDDYSSDRYWSRAKQFAQNELLKELEGWEEERRSHIQNEENAATELDRIKMQLQTGKYEITQEEQAELDQLQEKAEETERLAEKEKESFEKSPEKQNVDSIENDIAKKESYLRGLGIFKGKEKKEVQAQIDNLKISLNKAKTDIEGRQRKVEKFKQDAAAAKKMIDEYKALRNKEKEKTLRKRLEELRSLIGSRRGDIQILSPVPGKVLSISTTVGQTVRAGDTVITVEALKMEIPVTASQNGVVASIEVNVSDAVKKDDVLITMDRSR